MRSFLRKGVSLAAALGGICLATACQGDVFVDATPGTGPAAPGMGSAPGIEVPGDGNPGQGIDEPDGPPAIDEDEQPNTLERGRLFTCENPETTASPATVRRLSPGEFKSRWDDTPGIPYSIAPGLRYSSYNSQDIFDQGSTGQNLDFALIRAREQVGDGSREHPRCFWEEEVPDRMCLERFASSFLHDAYLRPATDEDIQPWVDFAVDSINQFGSVAGKESAIAVVYASPFYLYRTELGDPSQEDAQGRRPLKSFELAHALAFAISDTPAGTGGSDGTKDALRAL